MPAKPALVVADNRCGKLFLTVALSNHPDIHCVRGDPCGGIWSDCCKGQQFRLIWNLPFYKVSMFGLYWKRAIRHWDVIKAHKPPVKLLVLSRDPLGQTISREADRLRGLPKHTWKIIEPKPVTLDLARVEKFYRHFHRRAAQRRSFAKKCGLPVLFLTYREITGNVDATCVPKKATKRICSFLEIPVHPMHQKMHWLDPLPFSDWILNWDEILKAVKRG